MHAIAGAAARNPRPDVAPEASPAGHRLRLLSFNIQTGISSRGYHQYLTQGWRYVLPHRRRQENLDRIAQLASGFDIVGLQEVDGGSLRTGFVNQVEYLAWKAGFPFWHHHVHRNLGSLAQHSNGVLSRLRPAQVTEHRLPGFIPGRGAIAVRYGEARNPLTLFIVHLALGHRARLRQLGYLSELVNEHPHAILMGDMNCQFLNEDLDLLMARTRLRFPERGMSTFPSWQPQRHLDHILVSESLHVHNTHVLHCSVSDHLPIAMEVVVPQDVHLTAN